MRSLRRILLVRPNAMQMRSASSPPLGCLYLASAIHQWMDSSIEVRLLDMGASRTSWDRFSSLIRDFEPDVAGFSALSCEHACLLESLQRCKSVHPGCLTVVGGPHATAFCDVLIHEPNIDVLVRGEGERTFVELLQRWRDGESFQGVQGIVFLQDGQIVETHARPFEEDLDRLPWPSWDLLDMPAYRRENNMNGILAASPYMPVISTRGCPFQCIYCYHHLGSRYRVRSVENVMAELEQLYQRHGIREIHFIDDSFNLQKERVLRICGEIVARKLRVKIAFPTGVRGDFMDEEMLVALKSAGAYSVTYAVETASERLQKFLKKNLDLTKISAAIETTYKLGMIPQGFFMLGLPTETLEEMEDTIRFACKSDILKAFFFSAVPFPRTEFYEFARKTYPQEVSSSSDFSEAHSFWSSAPFYSRTTGVDITSIQRRAYRRFYFNPRRIFRILWRFPKNFCLVRGIFYGFQACFKVFEGLNQKRLKRTS